MLSINRVFIILFSLSSFVQYISAQQQVDIPWHTLANSDWPMIAHDPQVTGRSSFSGPKTATINWTVDLPYGVFSGPIIGEDGTLYVGTNSYLGFIGDTTNYFYAIDQKSGEIKWTYLTGDPNSNESGYLINNEGIIFFGSQSGWLYAIDTTGTFRWKKNTGGNIYQSVMNTDLQGNIYITNATDSLYCFSKEGQLNWSVKYGNEMFPSSVTISPDGKTIYVVPKDQSIYALDLNGNIKRVFSCVGNYRQPLTIDNSGNLYFVSGCTSLGSIISLDSTGQVRWEHIINNGNAGFGTDCSPVIDYQGNIYFTYTVGNGNSWFCRIESVDYFGNYRWTYEFGQPEEWIWAPLIVDKDGTIYCGSTWGYYYYAISQNGKLLWKLPLNGYQVDNSGAIGSDGTLYIGTHLSSTSTGQEKTLIAIRDTVTSVGDENQNIYKYKLEQNYPNPFNATTHIKYTIPYSGNVTIKVFDLLGREIAILLNRYQNKGEYDIIFQPENISSGIYFYQLQSEKFIATRKLMLMK